MELGLISLSDLAIDSGTGVRAAAVDRIDGTLQLARLADELGLDVFALGEHHSEDFAVSSPAVVLAAVAGQTQSIRLTSAVTVLSTLDPVRVHEDFAQLDLVSRGRAEITAGRSAFVEPFALFGVPVSEYETVFAEKLDLLLRLRETSRVTWAGSTRPPLQDVAVMPRPVQPRLPIWLGVGGSPSSAARAGRLGLPMMLAYIGGNLRQARELVNVYQDAAARAGRADEARVGISTHLYVAESERDAHAVFDHYHQYLRPKTPGGFGFHVSREAFDAGRERSGALMIGTPEQLVTKMLDARDELGIVRFYGQVDWGGLPLGQVMESVSRFATAVAPAVRARAAVPRAS